MVSPLAIENATLWIEDGTADRIAERKRLEAAARQELAREILHGCSYRSHPAAYNIWLELPPRWTSAEFAVESRRRGVAVTPASAFTPPDRQPPDAVRICLGAAESRNQLEAGLQVLARMVRCCEQCGPGIV
jgi:DNA-binding transcriptional MocR family regulator